MSASLHPSYHLVDKRFPIPRVEKYAELDVCLQDYHIIMSSTKPAFHDQIYVVHVGKTGLIEFIHTYANGTTTSKTKYSANNFATKNNNNKQSNDTVEDMGLKIDLSKITEIPPPPETKMRKSVSFNDAVSEATLPKGVWENATKPNVDLSGEEKYKQHNLEQEYKALEKQEQETIKILKNLEFHAIKRTFTDYTNFNKMPNKKEAEQIYTFLADMLKNDGCVTSLEELAKIDIEDVWRTQEHGLSPETVTMCKRYDAEMRRVKKNFAHKWDAFESDVPIAANIEINTKV